MKRQFNISLFRKSARNLRRMGVNASEMLVLEQIALNTRGGELRRLSASYIARPLGVSRQWINALLQRLEKLELITRLKTGFIRLNVELFSKNRPGVAAKIRRKASKWLKSRRKSESVNSVLHNKEILKKEGETVPAFTRVEAVSALKKMNADAFSPESIARRRAQAGCR
mgnify:CR=1 FL=1